MNRTILLIIGVLVMTGVIVVTSDRTSTPAPTPTATPTASQSPASLPTASAKPTATTSPKASPTGTPKPTTTPAPAAQQHTVDIKSFAFAPATLTVKKGDKVTFTNKDSAPHTATSVGTGWDSGNLSKNQSFTLDTATLAPGTYQYLCSLHTSMKGTLIVQ